MKREKNIRNKMTAVSMIFNCQTQYTNTEYNGILNF